MTGFAELQEIEFQRANGESGGVKSVEQNGGDGGCSGCGSSTADKQVETATETIRQDENATRDPTPEFATAGFGLDGDLSGLYFIIGIIVVLFLLNR